MRAHARARASVGAEVKDGTSRCQAEGNGEGKLSNAWIMRLQIHYDTHDALADLAST